MPKTLRVRDRAGWITKPIENRPENRLSSAEIDDTLLQIEDDYTAGLAGLESEIVRVDGDLNAVKSMFTADQHEVYFGDGLGGLTPGNIIDEFYIAKNESEVNFLKAGIENWSSVFGTWTRFSHGSLSEQPLSEAELRSWTLNPTTGQIEATSNSIGSQGFLSTDRYSSYVNEVVLTSSNSDDDYIGLVISDAYVKEEEKLHLLQVVVYMNSPGSPAIRVFSGSSSVGTTHSTLPLPGSYPTGWTGVEVKLKVVREGDIITIQASDPNGLTYVNTITLDLSSTPELQKFRGKTRYGIISMSQIGSSWKSIVAPGADRPIIDVTKRLYWTKTSGVWTSTSISDFSLYLGRSRFYYCARTDSLYRTDETAQPHEVVISGTDAGWSECTLLNGAAAYMSGTKHHPAMLRRIGNTVHIKGIIVPPTSSGLVAFELPVGFLPQHERVFVSTGAEFQAVQLHIGELTNDVKVFWSGTRPSWVSIECTYAID